MAILEASRKQRFEQNKFTAALKGINLDDATAKEEEDPVERIKHRIAAKNQGMSEEAYEWSLAGIGIEDENEAE